MGTSGDREASGRVRTALARVRTLLSPRPRLVDWSLFALLLVVLSTGLLGFLSGRPDGAWVFVTHGVAGLSLVAFLHLKLRRVRSRLSRPTPTRALSVLLVLVTVGALITGVWWVFGGSLDLGPWGLLNLHVGLGLLVVGFERRERPLDGVGVAEVTAVDRDVPTAVDDVVEFAAGGRPDERVDVRTVFDQPVDEV